MYRSKQPNRNSSGGIQKSEKKICEKTKRKRGQVKTYIDKCPKFTYRYTTQLTLKLLSSFLFIFVKIHKKK